MSRLLVESGEALYGPRWQSELARDLGVSDRTMRRWVADTSAVPTGLYVDLLRLLSALAAAARDRLGDGEQAALAQDAGAADPGVGAGGNGRAVSFVDDFELRYWQLDQRLPDPADVFAVEDAGAGSVTPIGAGVAGSCAEGAGATGSSAMILRIDARISSIDGSPAFCVVCIPTSAPRRPQHAC